MKRDKIVYGALLCGVVLLCNSCMLGRRQIKSPELELPATVVAGATDSLTMADMAWWNVYSDSTLTALIERTLERNKDMLAASARVRRMRALGRVARADQLPSVSGQLAADTEHNDYEGEPASDDPELGAKVSLAWELDLWGNLRWANRKAVAEYLATVDAQRALQMTLVAEVATAYYELVALDQELSIVRRTLQTRKEGVRQARLPHPLLAGLERAPHDAQLLIERHQFIIGGRHFGHERHLQRALRIDRSQVLGHGLPVGPAQIAPQIELPRQRDLGAEFGVVRCRLPLVVVVLGIGRQLPRYRRQLIGARHAAERTHPAHAGRSGQHVLVAFERAFDQRRERRIGVDVPPRHVGHRQRIGRTGHDRSRQFQFGALDLTAPQHTGIAEQYDAAQQRPVNDLISFHGSRV